MYPDPPEGAAPVRRLLGSLVTAVCRSPRLVLAVSFLLCAASLYLAATRLEYHTRRDDLISAHKECQQRWRKYLAEFGDDDDIVVVVKGQDPGRMKQALEALAERIRARSELFDRLFYKVDLRPLRSRALLFLPAEQVRTIQQEYLGDMKRLLDLGPLSWHGLGLLSIAQEASPRAARLVPGQPLSRSDERFLTQFLAISRAARATLADSSAYRDPWGSMMAGPGGAQPSQSSQEDQLAQPQYFFSGDKSLAFLLVRPVIQKGSFTAALNSVSAMRGIVAETRTEHPALDIGLTGMPVLETDEMVAAEHDTRLASWLAIAGVTLLFLIVYRGIAYPALTVVTLLVGTCWALGWTTLTVGHLNILSATFAVMLIGMGDYGVLWVMRFEQARRQGADVRTALLHTTSHVAVGNLTAASTLALAFFAATLADFKAVAELGWIAGCGVLLCAFACFTVLPALLMVFDRRGRLAHHKEGAPAPENVALFDPTAESLEERRSRRDGWLPGLARRSAWVLGTGLALTLVLAGCAWRVRYDHNLLHLQAQDLDSVQWEMTLIRHTAGASWHALSHTDTPEEALALKARYEKLSRVSRVVEVASLVPGEQERKLPMLRDIRACLGKLPCRGAVIAHPPTNLTHLRLELSELIDRLAPLARRKGAHRPLLAELRKSLRALHAQVSGAPGADGAVLQRRLRDFDTRLAGDLAENLHKLRDVSVPQAITVADLPPALRERYVGRTGKWQLRVFAALPEDQPADSLWDLPALEQFTDSIRTVDAEATGKPFGTVEGLKAMKHGLQRAGMYAFGVIVLVLWLDFRKPRNTLIAVTPLVLGVLCSLGVLGLCDIPLNPANMIAFPLILGVGVDNGVHILHDHLIRRREGRTGVSRAIGRGVVVKALTTMIGFGTLMISTERGLVGLGFILTLGVGCSMLAAVVLLPAALHLLERRRWVAEPEAEEERPAWIVGRRA
jgi:hopanoid biosynthesis associated RND transporter like protein HpnN